MTEQVVRLVVASGLVLLGACQTTGPVYQTYYVPEGETADATALVRAAEARCSDQADAQAQDAYDRTYRQGDVNAPRPTGNTTSNAPLALSPTQSAALVASRMASVRAQEAAKETWESTMKACMSEAGLRQINVCVSHCPQRQPPPARSGSSAQG